MTPIDAAPDLLDGFIVNCISADNRWQTDIQCALTRRRPGGEAQWAYLANSCRAEDVSPDCIFPARYYEAAVLHSWDGAFMIRSGAALNPPFPWQRKASDQRRASRIADGIVHCPDKVAREVAFQPLVAELQAPPLGRDNHLYMRIDWSRGGYEWSLFTRCRYINFPNPTKSGLPGYIQPISGPVLVDRGDGLAIGYVAAYVAESGHTRIETIVRHDTSLFTAYKAISGRVSQFLLTGLDKAFGRALRIDEYAEASAMAGSCRFYRYGKTASCG